MSEHIAPDSNIHNYPTMFRIKLNTNLNRRVLTDNKRYAVAVVKEIGS